MKSPENPSCMLIRLDKGHKDTKIAARRLWGLALVSVCLILTSCPTPPPAELPTRYYKMESATYYTGGGLQGPWIDVHLTSDSPLATQIFADPDGIQLLHWTDILSIPGKQLVSAGGYGNGIEIDPSAPLDPIADAGITVQADTTKWFYIKDYSGFLGAQQVSAKCRFDTSSVPIVFAGQQ